MVKGNEAIMIQLLGLQAIRPRRRRHFSATARKQRPESKTVLGGRSPRTLEQHPVWYGTSYELLRDKERETKQLAEARSVG